MINRYFPYGLSWEPIQARSVAIIAHCTPPSCLAHRIVSFLLTAAPISWFLSSESRLHKLLGRASTLIVRRFFPSQPLFWPPHVPGSQLSSTAGGGNASRSMRSTIAANKSRVSAKEFGDIPVSIPIDHRQEHAPPKPSLVTRCGSGSRRPAKSWAPSGWPKSRSKSCGTARQPTFRSFGLLRYRKVGQERLAFACRGYRCRHGRT